MKYLIIISMQDWHTVETIAEVEALGYPREGTTPFGRLRPELQGQPTFEGLCGPMWQDAETLRYETWQANDILSR